MGEFVQATKKRLGPDECPNVGGGGGGITSHLSIPLLGTWRVAMPLGEHNIA